MEETASEHNFRVPFTCVAKCLSLRTCSPWSQLCVFLPEARTGIDMQRKVHSASAHIPLSCIATSREDIGAFQKKMPAHTDTLWPHATPTPQDHKLKSKLGGDIILAKRRMCMHKHLLGVFQRPPTLKTFAKASRYKWEPYRDINW